MHGEAQSDKVREDRSRSFLRFNRWCTRWRREFARKREPSLISLASLVFEDKKPRWLFHIWRIGGTQDNIRDDIRACTTVSISPAGFEKSRDLPFQTDLENRARVGSILAMDAAVGPFCRLSSLRRFCLKPNLRSYVSGIRH